MNILKRMISFFISEKSSYKEVSDVAEQIEEHKFCPYCVNCELTEKKYGTVTIYICDQCCGFFLHSHDLNYFLEPKAEQDWSWLFWNYEHTEYTFNRSEENRKCPLCPAFMDNTQHSSGIWIDYCPRGHGIWLDGGEIKLIKDCK